MRRNRLLAVAGLIVFVTASGICSHAFAGHFFGNRGGTRGTWSFGFAGYSTGNVPNSGTYVTTPGGQPKQFYDSTGRWTGDGVDTMATNPHPGRRGLCTARGHAQ